MDCDNDSYSLDEWKKHHAHKNFVKHDGKIIESERAFRAAGLYAQANPSYQDWLAMYH